MRISSWSHIFNPYFGMGSGASEQDFYANGQIFVAE
jgi:hypothetical protein